MKKEPSTLKQKTSWRVSKTSSKLEKSDTSRLISRIVKNKSSNDAFIRLSSK